MATIGAAGVEVGQEVLAEARGAVLPRVPYLDGLRWVLIAVAQRIGKSRRRTAARSVGGRWKAEIRGIGRVGDVIAAHQRDLALRDGRAGQRSAGGREHRPSGERYRNEAGSVARVIRNPLDQLAVGQDLRPAELADAGMRVGAGEGDGGRLGDVPDVGRLQARAAGAEQGEDREAREADEGGDEGVAGADHDSGTQDGGVG